MATIVKASGEIAQFDKEKLRRSLLHVGAGQAIVDEIVERVEETMHSGMTTREIYRIGTCQQYETNLSVFLHPKFSSSFLRFICL